MKQLGAIQFRSLPGLTAYEAARELQLDLVEKRARDEIADTFLFLEHEPVITRGRGLQFTGEVRPRHMPVPVSLPPEISFAESERGGDLTYHGPGQLVVYPIVKLDGSGFGPHHDVAGFLRKLENVLISELTEFGLAVDSRENATGVWVAPTKAALSTSARKIASIGIAVRKWVTYHGLALNCVNDLKPFHLISPCGYAPDVMTSLAEVLQGNSDWERERGDWRGMIEGKLTARISLGA